jgi:hypothetical protein
MPKIEARLCIPHYEELIFIEVWARAAVNGVS